MHDKPDWHTGDTLRSIKDIAIIGALALKECVVDAAGWVDTKLADRINGVDDA